MADNPLEKDEFLVIEFDQRDASLTVFNKHGFGLRNRPDAIQAAQEATEAAQANGSPLQYVVVRISTEAVIPS
ncbi:MAG TPA: hypothetical protein VGS62_09640 [Streptosporangiaceae bacterium]|nr:hypothetical protein [Streptosporangiaceae bacterium]